jgi:hypothetical protein
VLVFLDMLGQGIYKATRTAVRVSIAVTLSVCSAYGEAIRISGGFAQQNSTPGFNGSFVMTFDVTGLPVADPPSLQQNGPSVPVSDLNITVSFVNGTTDSATGGSGSIYSMYNGPAATVYNFLSFSGGDIRGLFALIGGYDGNDGVLLDDGEDSSIITTGPRYGYLNGTSSTVTPEPSAFLLAICALFGLAACLGVRRALGYLMSGIGEHRSVSPLPRMVCIQMQSAKL